MIIVHSLKKNYKVSEMTPVMKEILVLHEHHQKLNRDVKNLPAENIEHCVQLENVCVFPAHMVTTRIGQFMGCTSGTFPRC